MNGVKQKFENIEVNNLMKNHDIVVVMETHFLNRHKSPKYFELVGRSEPIANVRRGGVAVYKKSTVNINLRVFNDICPDAVVFPGRMI